MGENGWLWAKQARGMGWAYGNAVAVDESGNTYVTGFFSGETDFDGMTLFPRGEANLFLTKYTQSGQLAWVQQIGEKGRISGEDVKVGGDGRIYVLGNLEKGILRREVGLARVGSSEIWSDSGDFFVIVFDGEGNPLTAFQAKSAEYVGGEALSVDQTGNCYVTGAFNGVFGSLRSRGGRDIFLVKYDSTGNTIWAIQAGGSGDDEALGVATNKAGSIYVTGFFDRKARFGKKMIFGAGGASFFVAKYDSGGALSWVRTDGGKSSQSIGYSVSTDGTGNCYVAGSFGGEADFGAYHLESTPATQWVHRPRDDVFVAKFDAQGVVQWARRGGGEGGDFGKDVAVDKVGNVYVSGSFIGSAMFDNFRLSGGTEDLGNTRAFLVKYDSAGTVRWIEQSTGSNPQICVGNSVAIYGDDLCYLVGFFDQEVIFGRTSLRGGKRNMFIAKALTSASQ